MRLGAGAFAEPDGGGTGPLTILNQLERDFVADEQLVERAERGVATVEEHRGCRRL